MGQREMEQRLKERLGALKSEYQNGQRVLAELDAKRTHLVNTLMRIEGAIQVLTEALGETNEPPPSPDAVG
jgi:predicted nuclease with TOPRIM domain